MADLEAIPVTISNGAALSPAVGIGVKVLVGISMPAAWTTAAMTFQVSPDGGTTWQELVDSTNAAVQIATPTAATFIALNDTNFAAVNNFKLRSGTSGSPVNQGADRIINLMVRTVSL